MAAKAVTEIGKYRIVRELAKGGMGTVFLAFDPSIEKQFIIKKLTIRNANATIRERFKREAQILMDLTHGHVVRVFEYLEEGRSAYIVMEYVEGTSLDRLLARHVALPPQLALLIFCDACQGLRCAHRKGIIHRDIKPGNILISRRAAVKLADFGIAGSEKDADAHDADAAGAGAAKGDGITRVGATLGTPAYMSPEQLADSSSVDQRADIYSMGVTLYEMVTGSKPFAGDMSEATIEKINKGRYVPPERLDPTLPPIVRRLIKKMMRPSPRKRYQSIDPIVRKVKRYLRRYDSTAIQKSLARAVIALARGRDMAFPAYEPKHQKARQFLLAAAAALLIVAAVRVAWNEGALHRTLLRPWYTPVTLRLALPAGAGGTARATFFADDNDAIPEVKGSGRTFTACAGGQPEEGGGSQMVTRPVFLHPGSYRIKITVGSYVWWKAVDIGAEETDIELAYWREASRPLTIYASAVDAETGKDLTRRTQFLMEWEGKLVDVRSIPSARLRSGQAYRLYASCPGYGRQYFGLYIDWYQDALYINSSLHREDAED